MKKIIAAVLIIILAFLGFLWFRSKQQVIADREGNPLRYTYNEIEEEGITGLFVHNADGTFSPAIRKMPSYQGATSKASASRYIWYVESDKDMDDLIPTVTSGSELVVVYNVDGDLSGSYYLEKYAVKGYTIGAHIRLGEDKTMYLDGKDPLAGSQAAAMLAEMSENTDDQYVISQISGAEALPIGNVDPNMNLLLGLERDKLYKMKYYQGTKEKEATFKADAKVFQSERYIPISTPYQKTSSGYFIVNLPQNLARGYYYLSDVGFFIYDDQVTPSGSQVNKNE